MEKSDVSVLIVDDEENIVKALKVNLEMDGYVVDTACSGKEALEKIHQKNYSIVLTDINMPEMDGLELLEKIKGQSLETIVIMITAYSTILKVCNARNYGASDYILKPFEDLEEVDKVMNRAFETITRWELLLKKTVQIKKKSR
ncbi:MAG: response regulator [Nitrospinota bacterium]